MVPIFFDPSGRRWIVLRRVFLVLVPLVALFAFSFSARLLCKFDLPPLLLASQQRSCHPLTSAEFVETGIDLTTNPFSGLLSPRPSANNRNKGVRAAFYVTWDPTSYVSLRDSYSQIDVLFAEWLHVLNADGRLQAVGHSDLVMFDVVQNGHVQTVDNKIMPLLAEKHADTRVVPEVNNFDEIHQKWVSGAEGFFSNAAARANFRQQIVSFLGTDNYKGLMLDFENIHSSALNGYRKLIQEVCQDLHARGLKLYVAAPANDPDYPYQDVAANSDGIVVMNYDQHSPESEPGPLASQNWFVANLKKVLEGVPSEKLICGIANYGYDWEYQQQVTDGQTILKRNGVYTISVQEAWEGARYSGAKIGFDSRIMNPHVSFVDDEPNEQHDIWYTDAVTALNQMRAAQSLGVDNFALWRLGAEDRSLWGIWDYPQRADAPEKLRSVPPGHDIDYEGPGEVLRITATPTYGTRTLALETVTGLIRQEQFLQLPRPYEASQYGASYDAEVALTFDDGPDPRWTPRILDVLETEKAPATFFVLGSEASKYPSILKRAYREGHEIGNHTWSHPDISRISARELRLELNTTERLFAAQLGVKPLLFRPPYAIDVEPEVDDDARPIEVAQSIGYVTVGSRIDPLDWADAPRHTSEQISADVIAGLEKGNIILLHDGGGNREETVRALPMIIHKLRERGYSIVSVSKLLGKSRAEVMPSVPLVEHWASYFDRWGFTAYAILCTLLMFIFLTGDALIVTRLLVLSTLAVFNRFRSNPKELASQPPVAVLIPAFNEEKVVVRTVCSVLASEYPNLRVIVIDDGSTDDTLNTAREAFAYEPRVTVLTKPNGGKAKALNYGLKHVSEKIFLGIDADTCIDPKAVSLLARHFQDPNIAAVAGNARVGNQINLLTRWQALEYTTSQNLERRALDVFGLVTVVPGAVGAWRTAAVRQAGCYHPDTVAEDADLTMTLLERGYRVNYEDRALAYTEAPSTLRSLARQRFRWSYGILQSVWKHRRVFKQRGLLGWVALPNIVIFQFVLPVIAPFVDLILLLGVVDYYVNQHSYFRSPDHSSALLKLVVGCVVFLTVDFVASLLALALERGSVTRWQNFRLLGYLWLQRFTYRQLFSLVILKTLKRVLQGHAFEWGKLERTAALLYPLDPEVVHLPIYADPNTRDAA
jgi:cellulose synthase/poly-beta-1,6-N-acetylglucosamine synthase-like glycosyltransferase/peptidoglycan/xylan/chitin deacetylase (PgdA/CDA1 family)/spore germination protein YaaH